MIVVLWETGIAEMYINITKDTSSQLWESRPETTNAKAMSMLVRHDKVMSSISLSFSGLGLLASDSYIPSTSPFNMPAVFSRHKCLSTCQNRMIRWLKPQLFTPSAGAVYISNSPYSDI